MPNHHASAVKIALQACALCGSHDIAKGDALCRRCHADGKTILDIVKAIPPNLCRDINAPEVKRELMREAATLLKE